MRDPLKEHEQLKGKIEVISRGNVKSKEDLSTLYTPGVSEPCLAIEKNPNLSYTYTRRHNLIAVISDGSAVLGLGNIGALAAMPVMEGKALLFKTMADVDAFPIVLNTQNTDEIIETILRLEPNFAGINLEDISAPRCFEIERKLKEKLSIPVFHDDQHGTAIVLYAALHNALSLVNKNLETVEIVINGAGAAGQAIGEYLIDRGAKNIIMCDKEGILNREMTTLSPEHLLLAKKTNSKLLKGSLKDALVNADVFIGVSRGNLVTKDMVETMAEQPILFPMANPIPEIAYADLCDTKAAIFGTGSSKYPNQINNLLAFPGIFRGALDSHAKSITKEMMQAASLAIAHSVTPTKNQIVPDALDPLVHQNVAKAVYEASKNDPKTQTPVTIRNHMKSFSTTPWHTPCNSRCIETLLDTHSFMRR